MYQKPSAYDEDLEKLFSVFSVPDPSHYTAEFA